ncbi:serologically defined colon cancer antigen 8 homolog isoform X4 [Plodia interpunctella]|uniref:serologically defined colon cancer antigen 8 homolog isoform X4 n=1 Tax=Plodia interpunctella TaxID=58824 RepID=UPI0031016513
MYPYFWYYRRPTRMNEYGLKRVPDYTELAYKEAVSKLRYFLSGTYAPSVRSYGGSPSLKNLDESDGDLDKKYTSYNTLAEYKPRPRLTAKYATLYADSLNNYTPQHVSSTPNVTVTSPADPGSAPNPDVINFIQKQEEYIEQLERESQYCRDELNNLLGKVKEVISENEHLHEAQKNKLISRMFHSYNAGSETDELDDLGDSTGLDSDNKGTPKRKGVKQRSSSVRLEGPNIVFESRIAELEAQLTQAKIDLKKVQDENNENKRKLASGLVDSTCLDGFKRQIDNLQRDKSSLEAQISKLKLSLDQKEGDLDSRYKRSEAEHQLREERNCLEIEIRRLKDELGKERSRVRELASEGSRRAVRERSAAEQRYTAHFDELQHDLAAQYDNVSKLQLDLERQRREENDLKRELSMKNAAIEELKMELKNKTSSLQADLAQAHAEKASLEEELARARLAIERLQRQAKHDANRLNSEIQSLRQRLDRADADLVHSRRENLRLSEQISTLEKEVNMKTLTPVTPEKKKDLSMMMESMENKHGCAQCRGRSDEPIRTQRDHSRSREELPSRRTKRRSEKESDSSNKYPPIIVGPLTTNQDLANEKGEKIYNLPLMIQQPFLREKKEPIKVDISVKLIPKSRKKEKKKKAQVEEIIIQSSPNKGVSNSISMEVTDGDVHVLKETMEVVEADCDSPKETQETYVQEKQPDKVQENIPEEKMEEKNDDICKVTEEIDADDTNESMVVENVEVTAQNESEEINDSNNEIVSEQVEENVEENVEE